MQHLSVKYLEYYFLHSWHTENLPHLATNFFRLTSNYSLCITLRAFCANACFVFCKSLELILFCFALARFNVFNMHQLRAQWNSSEQFDFHDQNRDMIENKFYTWIENLRDLMFKNHIFQAKMRETLYGNHMRGFWNGLNVQLIYLNYRNKVLEKFTAFFRFISKYSYR